MKRVNSQKGFTIIELVVVILLLGILAATALPRFMNIATEAHTGVARGLEGSLRSGLALFRATWTAQGQPAANTVVAETLRVAPGFTQAVYDTDAASATFEELLTPARFAAQASGYPHGTAAIVPLNAADAAEASAALDLLTSAQCSSVFDRLVELNGLKVLPGVALTEYNAETVNIRQSLVSDIATLQADDASYADLYAYRAVGLVDTGVADPDADTGDLENLTAELPMCVYVYAAEAGNTDRAIQYIPWTGAVTFHATPESLNNALLASAGDRVQ